ncbi:MAG: hypothetical protein ABEH43_07085, partial [Flavobacteriales bacterium]
MKFLKIIIASTIGTGYFPFGPGTISSLFFCLVITGGNHYFPDLIPGTIQDPFLFLMIILLLTLIGSK